MERKNVYIRNTNFGYEGQQIIKMEDGKAEVINN